MFLVMVLLCGLTTIRVNASFLNRCRPIKALSNVSFSQLENENWYEAATLSTSSSNCTTFFFYEEANTKLGMNKSYKKYYEQRANCFASMSLLN
jgi:hypothetical protein